MNREGSVPHPDLDALAVALRLGTALSSGFNTLYFLSYPGATPRRRIAALVLALVNLAFLAQALVGGAPALVPRVGPRLAALGGLVPLLAAVAMTALILWQLAHDRRS